MREVSIIGVGLTDIGEHWDKSIRDLAGDSVKAALHDAGIERKQIGALYVSNMIAGQVSSQMQLGAYIADFCGLRGVEASMVEAACASGGAAVRAGVLAVASGAHDIVAVCGVEKMTDSLSDRVTRSLATAADAEYEVDQGATFVAINALLMQRYLYEYNVPKEAFAPFSINAHKNAVHNPHAMFKFAISQDRYLHAPVIAPPINIMDASPICDGSATIILCPTSMAQDLARNAGKRPIRIIGSATATDSLALHDRMDLLRLRAVELSAQRAFQQAGISPHDVDVFELHDAFSIMSVLSLEACGFADRGQGFRLGAEGEIAPDRRVPISTRGGLKARGHPVGATGVYQVADVVSQLRCEAGASQVQDAKIGMAQNIGGSGATVVTHILSV
jgi:acetyl-CoA C-acetyltransferase